MAKVTRDQLKAWFMKGLYPIQEQFHHWIDSFWHKDDCLPMSSVEGLTDTLNGKADTSLMQDKQDKTDSRLDTEDKTVVGAINEVKDTVDALSSAEGITYENGAHSAVTNVAEALDDIYSTLDGGDTLQEITAGEVNDLFDTTE